MALILLFQGQWPRVERIEKVIDSFGEQSQVAKLLPIGSGLEQKVEGALSQGESQAQAIRTDLSPGDVSGFSAVELAMPLRDPVSSTHAVSLGLVDSTIVQPVVSYEIYLDGREIKGKIVKAAVLSDEDTASAVRIYCSSTSYTVGICYLILQLNSTDIA